MEDADVSKEVPFTPVRSSSENSGIVSTYSDASVPPNDGSVASGVNSGVVPPSPQRSYQNSVHSSPASVNKSAMNLSPAPVRTPMQSTPLPVQPELHTPHLTSTRVQMTTPFTEPEVGDLLGDYSEPPRFTPQPRHQSEPRILYSNEDDEDNGTDRTSSITAAGSEQVGYLRKDATSTFGKVVQPLKQRMNANKKSEAESDDDEEEASMPKGAIIFGYLQKQGRNGKWQTRWFESDGECLTYYKSSKRQKLLATLDLAKVGSIKISRQDPKGCSFTINISQRPYHLRADSKESCKDWVITLNRIKEARLMQGNVKLVNSQPPDLLDSIAPRVVVVAGRQRTHAVDDDDILNWEGSSWNDNPANEDTSFMHDSSSAKWQKSTRKLTKIASKVLRWARSLRNLGCADAHNQVILDHHVHPPGHDDYRRKGTSNSKKSRGGSGKKLGDDSDSSRNGGRPLSISRSMSLEDARVLS